ncbi:MAG TPA: hypothetical protein VKC66_13840 [Xanthobacteraceae bacterium]|nr:hypothetical protein [Xanthobacteraceae bacterium]
MTKAKHDRLLVAVIAKLPTVAQWPRADRIAWLQVMAMAFNVVYGPCGEIRVVPDEAEIDGGDESTKTRHEVSAGNRITAPTPPNPPQRFYVDRDGFAMADGKPIAIEDLPDGTILWDERIGIECGDVAAILWRDVGTTRRSLPPGVILRPVFDES